MLYVFAPEQANFTTFYTVGLVGACDPLMSAVATVGFGSEQDWIMPCAWFGVIAMTTRSLSVQLRDRSYNDPFDRSLYFLRNDDQL